MRVVRAYSGVVAGSQDWKKVEVEVDEGDLASLLDEADISVPREKIKTKHAFALLTSEAELLLLQSMVQSFGIKAEQVREDADKMNAQKELVFSRLRDQSEADNG
jgi:hypothetical protein